ncbi:MAG: hypothetical protein SWK76_14390 [Actinomycetota bacterium]|nr:hypothetical protein [Actinomycetota bacterium]
MLRRFGIAISIILAAVAISPVSAMAAAEGGHCSMGAGQSSGVWYFAEGYTGQGFREYLCIGNFQEAWAKVEITYMFSDGTTQEEVVEVPASSRDTIDVNTAVGGDKEVSIRLKSSQGIVAEREMYFLYQGAWSGGHCVVGATAPANTWYFAEGYTGSGFDEWICVLNTGDTPANLTSNFQTQEEGLIQRTGYSVPAHSRGSFKINDVLGSDYQTSLVLESSHPVVAERPMYFNYMGRGVHNWQGGHCVMGATSLSSEYYFAEGTTRAGFEEWICIQNPNQHGISVEAAYSLGEGHGEAVGKSYAIPAGTRLTLYVPDEVGPEKDVSAHLFSDDLFIAERPMYFLYQCGLFSPTRGGHCVIGATAPANTWYFAGGRADAGFPPLYWTRLLRAYRDRLCSMAVHPESGR